MAVTSRAHAAWDGSLVAGAGTVGLASAGSSFPIDWRARSEGVAGTTTPEELLAAAHAACFSMALSHGLSEAGTPPTSIRATADVTFVAGQGITGSHLTVVAVVPGLSAHAFDAAAQDAKTGCPVSAALAGIPLTLDARLESE